MKNIRNTILMLLSVLVIAVTFYSQFQSSLQDIEKSAESKQAQINRYIDLSEESIGLMAVYGTNYFLNGDVPNSELYSYLVYDEKTNTYNMDAVEGTKYQKDSGSLTGSGTIPSDGSTLKEINLVFQYNQLFANIYNKLPDVSWLYYTSKNDFIFMYPWVSSSDFKFVESLQEESFYTSVTPENDPLRKSVWTPVYLDRAGKGLMVTISSPIYDSDDFMGAVSLDITNTQLSNMIESDYEIHIIDSTDTIIATSMDVVFENNVLSLSGLLNCPQSTVDSINSVEPDSLRLMDRYYIYSVEFNNAPWKMIYRVSLWLLIGKATLYTLPIFAICLLLLLSFIEVERRKKSEALLMNSVNELTAYQKLLENAAKYDFLTSTANRRGLMDILKTTIISNENSRFPIQLIMGDIDHFKRFNDLHGHAAGDKILVDIAGLMQKMVGDDDVVCRWGGEEFLIMLMDHTHDAALGVAENIRKSVEEMGIQWENNTCLQATMTFGVAEYNYGIDCDSNIQKADQALYIGKIQGRNQVISAKNCVSSEASPQP